MGCPYLFYERVGRADQEAPRSDGRRKEAARRFFRTLDKALQEGICATAEDAPDVSHHFSTNICLSGTACLCDQVPLASSNARKTPAVQTGEVSDRKSGSSWGTFFLIAYVSILHTF